METASVTIKIGLRVFFLHVETGVTPIQIRTAET